MQGVAGPVPGRRIVMEAASMAARLLLSEQYANIVKNGDNWWNSFKKDMLSTIPRQQGILRHGLPLAVPFKKKLLR
jgi:hypothetical protein